MTAPDPIAPSPAASPEQPEGAEYDKTAAWNTCPTCGELVDIDDESGDGSEVRCMACNAHLVLAEYVDDTCGLVLVDGGDDEPDPPDPPDPLDPPDPETPEAAIEEQARALGLDSDALRRRGEEIGRSLRSAAAELTPERLDELDRLAREDKTVASRATARPWKWWTANSRRELRAEIGSRFPVVAHGQQHPHDRVIDIAIQEPDMALIERAVNGLEERADALLRLSAEVRRLREREVRGVLAEIDALASRLLANSRGELSDLLAAMQRAEASIDAARTARDPAVRRDLLTMCAAWAIAAIREMDRTKALASGEPPLAGEEQP